MRNRRWLRRSPPGVTARRCAIEAVDTSVIAPVEVGVHGLAQLGGRAFHSGTFGKAEGEVLAVPVILGLQPYERPMLFAIEKPVLAVDQVEATVVHHPVVGELEFLVVVESGPLHRRGR